MVGVRVDALAEFVQHFNGGAQLSGGGCLHNQTRMPRDDLFASSFRVPVAACEATERVSLVAK